MRKPWAGIAGAAKVEAYLGCWGCRTSLIGSVDHLMLMAATIYGIEDYADMVDLGRKIDELPKNERKRRVQDAIAHMFPEPDDMWPLAITGRRREATKRPAVSEGELLAALVRAVDAAGSASLVDGVPGLVDYLKRQGLR